MGPVCEVPFNRFVCGIDTYLIISDEEINPDWGEVLWDLYRKGHTFKRKGAEK